MRPIQRALPLVNQVYEHLREAILSGKFGPGEKIVETKLATDLEVSRSPVREAIRLLTNEQLLIEQGGSIKVFTPTLRDFQEISDLRLAIEPVAAELAAGRCNAFYTQKLEDNLNETKRLVVNGELDGIVPLNNEFHRLIWTCGGNGRFIRIMENVSALIQFYCSLVLVMNQQQTNIVEEHTEILQALKSGDSSAAKESMYRHILKDLQVIERYVESYDGKIEQFSTKVVLHK